MWWITPSSDLFPWFNEVLWGQDGDSWFLCGIHLHKTILLDRPILRMNSAQGPFGEGWVVFSGEYTVDIAPCSPIDECRIPSETEVSLILFDKPSRVCLDLPGSELDLVRMVIRDIQITKNREMKILKKRTTV